MKKNAKKPKKWLRFRHKIMRNVIRAAIFPHAYFKYGMRVKKFKEQNHRQYLILSNHQTAFDQFFVGMAFKGATYYVASEDLFSNGFISKVIKHLVAPIPIKKQTTDVRAVMDCLRVSKEGGTIALFPEGNRTYSGKTEYIKPSVVRLVKSLKLPIAFFLIQGGYGVQPRWSSKLRKGRMTAGVTRVVEYDEYKTLSDDQLYDLICKELYVDEGKADGVFKSKTPAEHMERAYYYCPDCGLSQFESKKDVIACTKCGRRVRYLPDKTLVGVEKPFPYSFTTEWYDAQADYMNALDLSTLPETPLREDTVRFSQIFLYRKKKLLFKKATARLYKDKIEIAAKGKTLSFPFDRIGAVTVLGRNKINLYDGNEVYQIKPNERFCAVLYVHLYYRFQNVTKGEEHVKFLGL